MHGSKDICGFNTEKWASPTFLIIINFISTILKQVEKKKQ